MEAKKTKPSWFSNVLFSSDDNKLMALAAEGRQDAFSKLFDKYKRPIMNYVYGMVKDLHKAEDITHDVFLKAFTNAHKYDPSKKFTTWLWTIAKNTTIDSIRKKKEILAEDMGKNNDNGESSTFLENVSSEDTPIDIQLIERSDKEVVRKCIDSLSESQKESITMRIFSEMSYQEIGEIINKTESAVKSLINRAKEALKDCVRKCSEA